MTAFFELFQKRRNDPHQDRMERMAKRLESPIERIFWSAGYWRLSRYGILTPQVNIRGYRADFTLTDIPGVPLLKIVIELDGHEWHKTVEQRNEDYRRDRVLMKAGWQVIRFTGAEVYGDCAKCVAETVDLIRVWSRWLRH